MTFEVISDPKLASDDSTAGRKLFALALRNAPIAQGVSVVRLKSQKDNTSSSHCRIQHFAPSILSLARTLSSKHTPVFSRLCIRSSF
jgi:hypothetical protein